jgi:tRNA(fMet)-specific endonuclease VapC
MPQFLFDTDHLTLFERNHPPILQRLRLQPRNAVAVSAVTVEESLRGRLAALSRCRDARDRINFYGQLLATIRVFSGLPLISWDQASEAEFQRLRSMGIRVGTQDLKISAIALANNLTLLTRNRVDFSRIPGLKINDWSN